MQNYWHQSFFFPLLTIELAGIAEKKINKFVDYEKNVKGEKQVNLTFFEIIMADNNIGCYENIEDSYQLCNVIPMHVP
mgnify:FL=1